LNFYWATLKSGEDNKTDCEYVGDICYPQLILFVFDFDFSGLSGH